MAGPADPGPVALGCAPLGNLYRTITDDQAGELIDTAFDRGVKLFDTAPHYGSGLSETRLGHALRGRPRSSYLLSTKVGRVLVPSDPGESVGGDIFVDTPPLRSSFDFTADGVRRSLEASFDRLGVDFVDFVHVHDPDDHLDEAIGGAYPALARLRDEGVIGAIGLGTNHASVGDRVLDSVDLDCLLLAGRLTLLDDSGSELFDRCAERGVRVLAAGVFNSGLLADPHDGAHFHYDRVPPEVLALTRRLADLCAAHDTTLAAAALHRPTLHPAVSTVVVGASSAAELAVDLDLASAPIDAALWSALRDAGAAV